MKKILYILFLLCPLYICALEYPSINSKIVEVYDINDDKVLYEVDSNKVTSIASLTKIATTITAIENINNLDEKVTITWQMINSVDIEASRAGLKAGDNVTYRDLLYASMLPSGADATNSLAILSSGSINNFVDKMNKLVNDIGLKNTHFVNVTGLDEKDHYSTADDMRRLLNYALKNELFREIYVTKQYLLSNGLTVYSTIKTYNTSGLNTDNIIGSKTGFTLNAGYCLSSLSNINGHDFIIIVLNGEHINNKFYNIVDTIDLINFLNNNYKDVILIDKDKLIKSLDVNLSNIDNYDIYPSKDVIKYLPSDYDINKLKIEYDGKEYLNFKDKNGDNIGKIYYYYDNELFYKEDVILDVDIKISIIKVIKRYIILIIVIILVILFFIKKVKIRKKRRRKRRNR